MTEIPVSMTEAAARAVFDAWKANSLLVTTIPPEEGECEEFATVALVAAGVPALLEALGAILGVAGAHSESECIDGVWCCGWCEKPWPCHSGEVRDLAIKALADVGLDPDLAPARASGFLEGDT